MKKIKLMIIAILLAGLSGCFPVFVPVDDGHGHHRHNDHRGDHYYGEQR